MSWTEERITMLQQLWSDGLSASQIASKLGGVTRNAVIGKVHRLGLSDKTRVKAGNHRAGPSALASQPEPLPDQAITASVTQIAEARAKVEASRAADPAPDEPEDRLEPTAEPIDVDVVEPIEAPISSARAAIQAVPDAPEKGSVGILELTEQSCRWPFGDPTRDDFHFCGARSPVGEVYCKEHAKVAFQPPEARRRR